MGFWNQEYVSFVAGEALTRYQAVKLDTTVNQVVTADEGQTDGVFITMTAAASGGHVACIPLPAGNRSFKLQAAGAVALGAKVGIANTSGQFDDSHAAQGLAVALEAATGAGEEFLAVSASGGASGSAPVQAQTSAGTSLENSTTETTISSVEVIEGDSLSVGDVIEVIAAVLVEDNNSTDTLKLDLMFGTEEICTVTTNVDDGDIGYIHAFITIRATGSSGSLVAAGEIVLDAPGTLSTKFMKAAASEDLSGSVNVYLDGTWSVAHADNEAACETFIVKHHKAG